MKEIEELKEENNKIKKEINDNLDIINEKNKNIK